MGTIARFLQKIKSFARTQEFEDRYIIFLIIISGFTGFLLGRMSTKSPIMPLVEVKGEILGESTPRTVETAEKEVVDRQRPFLASKNGTKYYPSDCSGANKILTENRIWFETEEDAVIGGYERSLTCK